METEVSLRDCESYCLARKAQQNVDGCCELSGERVYVAVVQLTAVEVVAHARISPLPCLGQFSGARRRDGRLISVGVLAGGAFGTR